MSQESCIEIDGMKINYVQRGSGASVLLLLHSAVGSHQDFRYQLDEQDGLSGEQFTMIAPDLPGYGKSELISDESVSCEPTSEYFELCAEVCAKLMAKLNHKTYSIGGWNDGARIGALMAIKWQSRCNSLILWGFAPLMDNDSCLAIVRTRDTSSWEPKALENYTNVYGQDQFAEMWRKYVDKVFKTLESTERFDIRQQLAQIKCPTLVLHGKQDPIISWNLHIEPIEMQIYDSEIKQFAKLAHNLHQADPEEFNCVIGQFVQFGAAAA